MDFNSNFSTLKLISIRFVLFLVAMFPWLFSLYQKDWAFAVFAILVNILVLAITIYMKVSIKIIIVPQEQIIEYYWMTLWGRKHCICINIKNAHINIDTVNYKGNDLRVLIITGNKDENKKISITEITDGFDRQQIKTMYQLLKQINIDQATLSSP